MITVKVLLLIEEVSSLFSGFGSTSGRTCDFSKYLNCKELRIDLLDLDLWMLYTIAVYPDLETFLGQLLDRRTGSNGTRDSMTRQFPSE
jgi:hypothetical protein